MAHLGHWFRGRCACQVGCPQDPLTLWLLALGDTEVTSSKSSAGSDGDHTGKSLWLALKVDLEAIGEAVLPAKNAVRTLGKHSMNLEKSFYPDRTLMKLAYPHVPGFWFLQHKPLSITKDQGGGGNGGISDNCIHTFCIDQIF